MFDNVKWLRQASPYIHAHRSKTFVVMLPGESIEHSNFHNIIYDLVLLHSLGIRLVLVYDSRLQIDRQLVQQQITPQYYKNLRVTDGQALSHVIDVVGRLRTTIEAKFSMGLASSPMQGSRERIVSGNFIVAKPIGVVDGVDYYYTGEVRRIDSQGITRQLDEGNMVLIPPIGNSPTGEVFNMSCDAIANAVAIKLQADKLILYGVEQGILDEQQTLIRELRPHESTLHIQRLGTDHQANLLDIAASACRQGVSRSHIVSYVEDGALLAELFTHEGSGTLVAQEQFEKIREATIDDVGGLIELIRPLEEQGTLIRRSRELLEREINQFTVIEREGMIIACVALYSIPDADAGELACLAVSSAYSHSGKGDDLLTRVEQLARQRGMNTLFVLTTRTAHWFVERGFQPCDVEDLPTARASLYNFQRNSKVFKKKL